MIWSQVYDPFGSMLLSTSLAAVPVVVLLGAIGIFEIRAHIAAAARARRALAGRDRRLRHAGRHGRDVRRLRRRLRPVADRLDHPQRHLPLPAYQREGRVRRPAAQHPQHLRRPAAAAPVHRLLLRRLLRGRRRLRHAGRGDRRHADRPRLLSALRRRPVADRQHRAGRLRRARHAGDRARRRDRPRPARAQRHDRPAAAVLLADRAVLADLGLRRLPPDAGGLAGAARRRRLLRRPAVPRLQLPRPLARRRRRRDRLDGLPRRCSCASGSPRHADDRGAARLVVARTTPRTAHERPR